MLFKKRPQPPAETESVAQRVAVLESEVRGLRREMSLLDAQFDELIDKAYRKWERVRVAEHRDTKREEKPKSAKELLREAARRIE